MSERKAHLVAQGILKFDEEIYFSIEDITGPFAFALSNNIKDILQRFCASLSEVSNDAVSDVPTVVVVPPIPIKIRLLLRRQT